MTLVKYLFIQTHTHTHINTLQAFYGSCSRSKSSFWEDTFCSLIPLFGGIAIGHVDVNALSRERLIWGATTRACVCALVWGVFVCVCRVGALVGGVVWYWWVCCSVSRVLGVCVYVLCRQFSKDVMFKPYFQPPKASLIVTLIVHTRVWVGVCVVL